MGEVDMKPVKLDRGLTGSLIQDEIKKSTPDYQGSEGNRSSNVLSTSQSGTSVLDQGQSPVDETNLSSVSPLCPAPLCRQFWKAGNYDESLASKTRIQNSKNYLHVHPKFLHSNATSHKWAFGAIAELLDNAIDEIQNGATFVIVDKISNPRDGTPALLIQDDGGGMDPEAMRRCMSFGFSDKKSTSAIGRYGNGFKTSTMRLGADVVVFSRHVGSRTLTQSIGLLSYTYLTRTGLDRIVVPMVDYDFNMSTGAFEPQYHNGRELFQSNLSIILQWSPFSTETELLKQFDNIESHGTKVIIYNLWLMDDGNLEFDFETDPKDIRLHGSQDSKKINAKMLISEAHIGNQYRYSLLVYLSILYLRMPQSFTIILRGEVVEHHNIASDLKFPEFILYKPQTAGVKEGQVITTIGFLKEAPHVYLHGFNVYHKNRLILPFWHVVSYSDSRGRGVVGILEANFVEPTHNKQDFERTSLFQKLEARLKEMTWEYWDYHCGLIGYQVKKKARLPASLHDPPYKGPKLPRSEPVNMDVGTRRIRQPNGTGPMAIVHDLSASGPAIQNSQGTERKQDDFLLSLGRGRRQYKSTPNTIDVQDSNEIQPTAYTSKPVNEHEASVLMQEQNKLQAKCLEHEKMEEELNQKVAQIEKELEMARDEYARMLEELQSLEAVKPER